MSGTVRNRQAGVNWMTYRAPRESTPADVRNRRKSRLSTKTVEEPSNLIVKKERFYRTGYRPL